MYMNRQYYLQIRLVLSISGLLILSGCSTAGRVAKTISVEPEKHVLVPDSTGAVELDVLFHIPEKYVSMRSRLSITPQLILDDSLFSELSPLVVDAPIYTKKLERKTALENYQDPNSRHLQHVGNPLSSFDLRYHTRLDIDDQAQSGLIRAVVRKDGCGKCQGLDTLYLAGISNLVSLIDAQESLDLSWIEPQFVIRPKIREEKGEALLQFVINKYNIDLSLGNNSREMMRMIDAIEPILDDSLATVRSINIYGMASADGPYNFNTVLARNRASSAKDWLVERLRISKDISKLIQTDSRPEGWWPVYYAMSADGHPDTLELRQILTTYDEGNDDIQESYIRRLSCWADIRSRYLPKNRKVEYVYSYAIRSFTTDEELLAMYRVRPDAFNEDELLRVAALATDDSTKIQVYRTLMHYFPQSTVAANNLALLYLRTREVEKARQTLETQKDYSPEMLATLAISYVYENDYERAVELLQDIDLPEARYNLGLLEARQYNFAEAYSLLKDYRDVNSAIVALSVLRNAEAKDIMDELKDESPLAEYVRALVSARMGDEVSFLEHLQNACKDERLCKRAAQELDFMKFRQNMNNVEDKNKVTL